MKARFFLILVTAATASEIAAENSIHPWAAAELVWPSDPVARMWQSYQLMMRGSAVEPEVLSESWPKSVGEICHILEENDSNRESSNSASNAIRAFCEDKKYPRPFILKVDFGAYPIERRYPLGKPFEHFDGSWVSELVNPEEALTWSEIPSTIQTELSYPISDKGYLHFRIGLRRDLSAWDRDALGLNLPLSDKEVDLNEPSQGYFHFENGYFGFTVGRFPVHWSPSPEFGLALSDAVPFHNAAEFALKMPHARYRFLISSLNPWLEGTPLGDTSSEAYPPGSEQYLQRHYRIDHGASIFHKRIYAEDIKTLFAHRVEGEWGPVGLGITETEVIGGKVPDLRDAGPFVFFHNDFKDGYTNSALSLDASLSLPAGFSLAGELYLDDVQFAETEGEGNTASLLGYLAAVRHAFSAHGWAVSQSLHAIRTDPYLYGYLQPLSTMASRHILASNNQVDGDPLFVDRYVVDYPMGYLRGGDAFDFWYRAEGWYGSRVQAAFTAALLAQGVVDIHTPYQNYYSSGHDSPTGTAEREVRLGLEGGFRVWKGLSVHGGVGWQGIRNADHRSGNDLQRVQINSGAAYRLP